MSQRLFKSIGFIDRLFARNAWLATPIHFVLDRLTPHHTKENPTWDDEIAMTLRDQTPVKARALVYWSWLIVVALIVWAHFAEIEEVTRGEGRVIPSGQVQMIQSLDGGIVSQILVKEGENVVRGQPLIKIDETRAISSLKENKAQYLALVAKQYRLRALAEGGAFSPPKEIMSEVPEVYQQEQALYYSSKEELSSQVDIAREQMRQKEKELQEVRANADQAERGYEFSKKELAVTKPLQASGAVSDVDILRLERDVSKFQGEREQALAQIGKVQASISEAKRKMGEIEQTFRSKVRTELNDTTAKINSLTATSEGLSDKVKQATLKSPVNGKISRLFANTVGGVIQPGKDVMEIVPTDDALVLETKIQPKDIAFVTQNQKATVKLTAYDYTIYGSLNAVVENVGADSVIDDKGNVYYLIRVRTVESSLGKNLPIIPGMVAQVDIITGKKTVLSYLLKPVLKAKSYAFTER